MRVRTRIVTLGTALSAAVLLTVTTERRSAPPARVAASPAASVAAAVGASSPGDAAWSLSMSMFQATLAAPVSAPVPPPAASAPTVPAPVFPDEPACAHGMDLEYGISFPFGAEPPPAWVLRVKASAASSRDAWIAALRARGDEFSLAATHRLALDHQSSQPREDLARMASTTQDARVYALAYAACNGSERGNCQLVNAARWSELDPTNAFPWLHLAWDLAMVRDRTGMESAMRRAAGATRIDDGSRSVVDAVQLASADSDAAAGQSLLLARLLHREMDLYMSPSVSVMPYCLGPPDASGARPPRLQRAGLCLSLAEMVLTKSADVAHREAGVEIGSAFGWPAERVERQRSELRVLAEVVRESDLRTRYPLCHDPKRLNAGMRERAQWGEAEAAMRALARSGTSMDARIEQMRSAAAASAAAQAASGAPAASAGAR